MFPTTGPPWRAFTQRVGGRVPFAGVKKIARLTGRGHDGRFSPGYHAVTLSKGVLR